MKSVTSHLLSLFEALNFYHLSIIHEDIDSAATFPLDFFNELINRKFYPTCTSESRN